MPYRRKYVKRRYRKGSSAPWYKKKYSPMEIASKAYSGVKALRKLVNVEFKKFDLSNSGNTIDLTGSVNHLSGIAQGDTVSSREGNSILAKSLLFRGHLARHASASTTIVRFLIVRDNQQIADTTPGMTDVLDPTVSTLIFAPLNDVNVGRFTVLHDQTIRLDDATGTLKTFDIYIPMNKHIRYNSTASTDIQRNGLYAMWCSNEGTNLPTNVGFSRLTYVDN